MNLRKSGHHVAKRKIEKKIKKQIHNRDMANYYNCFFFYK